MSRDRMHHSAAIALLLLLLLVATSTASETAARETKNKGSDFSDPIQVLAPERARDEIEADRVLATARFVQGRLMFRRRDFPGALRHYQRAWRYDPTSVSILRDIVDLAFSLKRNEEAARYAVLLAERDSSDQELLKRLAIHLSQQKDYERALQFYERVIELSGAKGDRGSNLIVQMEMGRLYFLNEQFEKAADCFEKCRKAIAKPSEFGLTDKMAQSLLHKPDRTFALFGETFLQAERFDDALAMFKKSHEKKPNESNYVLQLARIAARQKKPDDAIEQLDQYFKITKEVSGVQPYILLVDVVRMKWSDKATANKKVQQRLEALRKSRPNDASLGYLLAGEYLKAEDFQQAENLYRSELTRKPAVDGYVGLLQILTKKRDTEGLLETLGDAILKAGSLEPISKATVDIVKDEELIGELVALVRKRKSSDEANPAGAALAMSLLSLQSGDAKTGNELFRFALKETKPSGRQMTTTWGLELFMADEYEMAAETFREGLDSGVLPKENAEFHFYLAGAYAMARAGAPALAAAEQAVKLEPKSLRYKARIPWIHYRIKNTKKAEEEYKSLIDQYDQEYSDPEIRDTLRDARFVLSNIAIREENLAEAEEWLEQVLDEYPEDIGALNDLGYLWADADKRLQRAHQMIIKALDSEPDNVAYLDSLGWVLFRLGQTDEAIKYLEKATAGDDPDGTILDHLGDAYREAGKVALAVKAWRKALGAIADDENEELTHRLQEKIERHSAE